ncbi:MAG: YbaK/EbsC family protein [Acidimicrobiia bacterium]|nr:YbaK/EbsC family protein [Acidimicrobiia bacterium]
MSDPLLDAISALEVDYDVIPCDPDLADTAQFCEAYGYSPDESANTILVVGKSDPRVYVACVVLASTRLDVNGRVKKKLGIRRTSFASGEETAAVTGQTIGGVTPFGLPDDLPIWVDERVTQRERIILGGGSRDRKIYAPPQILTALPNVEVVADLAKEFEPRA